MIASVICLWSGSNGGFGGVLLLAHNWADWQATRRSYELMARYVHPHFQRNANELRNWTYNDAKSKYGVAGAQSRAAVQAAIDRHGEHKRLRQTVSSDGAAGCSDQANEFLNRGRRC